MRIEIKNWIDQAFDDFVTAKVVFEGGRYYAAVFFCQQAIEKALKSLILHRTRSVSDARLFSHSLIFLGKEVGVPKRFFSFLRELTPHYALTRYPDTSETRPTELYDQNLTKEFLSKTEELLTWIKKQLK